MTDEKKLFQVGEGMLDPAALWEQVAKPWEEAAIASMEQMISSRPALAAMFAPLRLWLEGMASTKGFNERALRQQGCATQSDLGEIMAQLRKLESHLLDLEDRLVALEGRGKRRRTK